MSNEEYVKKNQIIIDYWKDRFSCLFYWDIRFVYDGIHWSHTMYDTKNQMAVIYPCDIEDEESYLVHEMIKLSFIACEHDMEKRLILISDLVTVVTKD